ncbi:hypothetical protein [Hymenobacter properus]|uniref:M50 family peptidase n=1 Tax=Hymenobacter properus TaxID=2791026 RepID=A0A931BJ05_9BACT|nr:hypothetical protein [Hymenobacter properus]MBF9143391.1 hypothetical protein [Hymenobacter properus]MBR7722204.1 hypothetical protein [Microvirga sp. SRT04]
MWPLLIVLHELGHALPALLFTRAKVTVYLGSYDDSANSWRTQLGLLEIYAKRSFFWNVGRCVPSSQNMTTTQQIIMVLGGAVGAFAVAALGFCGALVFDLHGALKLFMFSLTLVAAAMLVGNLAPRERNGMANDGWLLKQLLANRMVQNTFAPELEQLIARSREVAIDLGYDYISTRHLFLADCLMPYRYSLANVFFPDPAAREAYYEQHRVGPANPAAGSLPLTQEFDQALRRAPAARRHGLSKQLYPCHVFLAATEVANSEFNRVAMDAATLPQTLLSHYRLFDELWKR